MGRPPVDPELLAARGAFRVNPQRRPGAGKKGVRDDPDIEVQLHLCLLSDGVISGPYPRDGFADAIASRFDGDPKLRASLWSRYGEQVLQAFVMLWPGQRPQIWWQLRPSDDAERRRVGGYGTALHEVLGYARRLKWGLPVAWLSPWEYHFFRGTAIDVYGNPIGTEYRSRPMQAQLFNFDSPPVFEAEAAYLEARDLFLPGEKKRLPRDAFTPEVLPAEWWPDPRLPGQKRENEK